MTAPHPYPRPPYQPAPYQQVPYQQVPYQPYPQMPYPQMPYQPPWAPAPSSRRGVVAAVVVVAVLGLVGLVLAAGAASGGTTRATTGATTRATTVPGTAVTAGGETPHCPGGSLEGCFTEAQMPAFLTIAVGFVQGFSDDSYAGKMPHPGGYQLIAGGRSQQSACGEVDAMSYAYCPGDDRVYIGQTQLWQLYSQIGDAAAVVGLAHEYGHHIQNVVGVPDDSSPRASVVHENQADCIAGAFVGWAERKNYMESSDTRDIEGLVTAIASSEDDPNRDHGTRSERAAALSTGLQQGLTGCNDFYPQTPVG